MKATSLVSVASLAAVCGQLVGCATTAEDAARREEIEWCNVWVTGADKDALPRVLLIGDSITQAYFEGVQQRLAGKANCARITTSKCIGDPGLLPEVDLLLRQYRFKVIHVNNGMHGLAYSEEQYRQAFEPFMKAIIKRAKCARVIWAHTTPVMKDGSPENERTTRIRLRNQTAEAFASKNRIPVNDLFGLVVSHPEYYSPDGVHLNRLGMEAQARQVADRIMRALHE